MTKGLRIAVADDEPQMRGYYEQMLPLCGYEVVAVAGSGRDLVEQCRRTQPDLVLSDVRMPDGDGLDASREICGERQLPFILVSAYHDPELISRVLEHPVAAYLVKPLCQGDLEATIPLMMRRFQEMQALREETATLRRSLEERKIVERAKGAMMKRMGLGEQEVFRRLRKLASNRNRKLAEIAEQVLQAEEIFQSLEGEV
jgi:response regulator NasT